MLWNIHKVDWILFLLFIKEDKKRSEMRGKTRENINVSLLELTKSAEV